MTRVQQLNDTTDEMLKQHVRWTEDPNVGDTPPPYFCDAIENTVKVFDAGPCPVSHIPLNNAVTRFNQAYQGWLNQDADWVTKGLPSPAFYRALAEVRNERSRLTVTVSPIKSVKIAREQGATDDQIAKSIYGFLTSDGVKYDPNGNRHAGPFLHPNGQIDNEKLDKEFREAGSVVPRDWINPRQRYDLEKAGYFDQMPAVDTGTRPPSDEERKALALRLLRSGGTLEQIRSLTSFTDGHIAEIADEAGIPMPFSGDETPKGTSDELDAAILEELVKGSKANQIVNTLKTTFPQINLGIVNNVRLKTESTAPKQTA